MAERSARVVAQAKVNLFLKVEDLLESGYHNIVTLFQRIELGDDVVVRCLDSSDRNIACSGLEGVPPESNIAFRAAALYSEKFGWPAGFAIEIDKHIPVGGGLGGGSADAAAVLRVLDALAPTRSDPFALRELALRLGSDVPFLVSDHCFALARGRGERMQPLASLPVRGVTLFKLPFSVSTAEAYRWIDAERAQAGGQSRHAPHRGEPGPHDVRSWNDVSHIASNDFEDVVGDRHPELPVLLAAARSADFQMAEMTGSGSTVFAISWDDEPSLAPEHVASGLPQLLTRTANRVAEVEG